MNTKIDPSVELIPAPPYLKDAGKIAAWHNSMATMFDYIWEVQNATGFPPSYRQIVSHFVGTDTGLGSTCSVFNRMELLRKYGFIVDAPFGKQWKAVVPDTMPNTEA